MKGVLTHVNYGLGGISGNCKITHSHRCTGLKSQGSSFGHPFQVVGSIGLRQVFNGDVKILVYFSKNKVLVGTAHFKGLVYLEVFGVVGNISVEEYQSSVEHGSEEMSLGGELLQFFLRDISLGVVEAGENGIGAGDAFVGCQPEVFRKAPFA